MELMGGEIQPGKHYEATLLSYYDFLPTYKFQCVKMLPTKLPTIKISITRSKPNLNPSPNGRQVGSSELFPKYCCFVDVLMIENVDFDIKTQFQF
jgi:hypothetical protein